MPEAGSSWRRRLARIFLRGHWLVALLLLALLALRFQDPAVVQKLRFIQFDLFQQIEPRPDARAPVVIVDIDDASLAEIGQWPWPRDVLAKLVDRLREAGIGVIGFDVTFPEADRATPGWVFDALGEGANGFAADMMAGPSNDTVFADAMRKARVVLGMAGSGRITAKGDQPIPTPLGELGGDPRPYLPAFPGIVANLAELDQAAAGRGAFSLRPETDTIIRRVPTLIRVEQQIYPSLVAEILRVAMGEPSMTIRSNQHGIDSLIIQKARIPTDRHGNVWVRYQQRDPSIYIPAADILAGKVLSERLQGRIALVGTSAAGLEDIVATPLGVQVPGVEIHWQLLGSILSNQYLYRLGFADAAEMAVVLVIGLLIILLAGLLKARWTALLLLALLAASAGGAWYAFSAHGLLFDTVYPGIAAILLYTAQTYISHHASERQRRQVSEAFGRYVSPVLVQRLAKDATRLELGGETRDMSILFCDIRGFTQISERFKGNPQGLTALINRFLTPLTEEVMQHQGTIDKYMGDCIMAFWNAPLDDPRHARNACTAALAMFRALDDLNAELSLEARQVQPPETLPRAYRRLKELGDGREEERLQIAATLRSNASEGHAYAQYTLGKAYRDGLIGRRSADEAVRWFAAAAEQGYSPAQRNLGERLARGDGVARDEIQALHWLTLAARDGLAAAEEVRIELMQRMSVAEIAAAERRARAWRPNSPRVGITAINMGIGINTGECVVGNMGSRLRFDYSVLGDAVNVAARLESQSSNYGVDIVISESTYAEASDFAAIEIDRIIVKGKSEPIRIYALLGTPELAASDDFRDLSWRHAAMLQAYRERQWQECLQHVEACAHLWPRLAPLYDLYRDRVENYLVDPPGADWDGVFVALKK
ncbi:CHASE2 domain-containing sensor protein [Dongia mobilis]|uniref:CHASE2 domain-containing sensor protein n=1 Tax=Dongia mobilis TaxID=578943 RepID=A0A4R6WRS3_9PROT|nr:CHASE2 domain-containing protein [Dongia mobilis]TDQ81497.1 CHASE2 domain-containing sensor protein [Dongia mobilis]